MELGVSIATVSRALRNSPEIGLDMQRAQSFCPEPAQGSPQGHRRCRSQFGDALLCCRS